jgi:PPK2 family polyphosphate:nucleotide phosphotransferase
VIDVTVVAVPYRPPSTQSNHGVDAGSEVRTVPPIPRRSVLSGSMARSPAYSDHRAIAAAARVARAPRLDRRDPAERFRWQKNTARAYTAEVVTEVSNLQQRLFAEGRRSVLVVLQAIDAGGKDGTIRTVFTGINPAGVTVSPFGVPSEVESEHDYLWRIHQQAPRAGRIGVLNRSHYEDVIVVRVKDLVPEERWSRRFAHIRHFEQLLVDEGTAVVKLFLHISKEEQRIRLQDRVDSPDERWKFRLGDLDDRALWDEYMAAYSDAIEKTTTRSAPWYVVPADRKWVRNLVVASILRSTLEELDPQYPEPEAGVAGLKVP